VDHNVDLNLTIWSKTLKDTRGKLLKVKAELFPWVKVVEVGEAYTFKTCEECGHIHQILGGNKTFRCPSWNKLVRYLTRENIILPGVVVCSPNLTNLGLFMDS